MNKQKRNIFSIAAVIVLIIMGTYAGMRSDAPAQIALPTQALIQNIDPPPPPTNVSSEYYYDVNPVQVKVIVDALPIYEAPYVGSEKVGECNKDFVWTVEKIRSTHDGNYWGKLGNGWVLLYNAEILDHESTDWSLEKWIGNGKQ